MDAEIEDGRMTAWGAYYLWYYKGKPSWLGTIHSTREDAEAKYADLKKMYKEVRLYSYIGEIVEESR